MSPVFLFISGFASPFEKVTAKSITLFPTVTLLSENVVSILPVKGEIVLAEDSNSYNVEPAVTVL